MISLSTSGNSIIFAFQDNPHYLQNGTIEVPKNSLTLVTDDSGMATFKKSASNDIFISALYSELGMSKSELETWFKENAVGTMGGDITSGEVQTMIDESISGKQDSSIALTQAEYDALVSGGTVNPDIFYIITDAPVIDISNYYTSAETNSAIAAAVSGKADTTAVTAVNNVLTAHTADTTIHVTSADKTAWNAKSDFSGSYNDLTDKPTIPTSASQLTNDAGYITEDALSGYAESSAVTEEISAATSGLQETLVSGTNIKTINNESILGSGNIDIQGGGKAIEAGRGISVTTGATADTVSFNLPISAGTGEDSIIIGRYDTSRTSTGKGSYSEGFATTSSGQYSHAEGGNTYATAIYAHAEGFYGRAKGEQSHAEGYNTNASGKTSHVEGTGTQTKNESEHASGHYNNSVSASTTFGNSGNTLFSVGNGTSNSARHNAFEIRQNGDIYLTKDGQDVKLQDQLGGGEASSAITSGDTNAVAGGAVYDKFDEVEQVTAAALNNINDRLSEDEEVTAAGLNALNDNFGGLKLMKISQTDYDNLQVKDQNTLYIVI